MNPNHQHHVDHSPSSPSVQYSPPSTLPSGGVNLVGSSGLPMMMNQSVQYTPQVQVSPFVAFSPAQQPTNFHEEEHHHDDSMLELKDYDQNVPSNFAVVSRGLQQTGNQINSKEHNATAPLTSMSQPSPHYYPPQSSPLPSQQQQHDDTTYSTNNQPQIMMMPRPTSNNYIMNPGGHVMTTAAHLQHSYINPEMMMTSKYSTWTRVVLVFAILLTLYGVVQLTSFFFTIYAVAQGISQFKFSVSSLVMQAIITVIVLVSGSIGIYSTLTKNVKHRKYSTIAHLISLA